MTASAPGTSTFTGFARTSNFPYCLKSVYDIDLLHMILKVPGISQNSIFLSIDKTLRLHHN